jgi:hypothetical protein
MQQQPQILRLRCAQDAKRFRGCGRITNYSETIAR